MLSISRQQHTNTWSLGGWIFGGEVKDPLGAVTIGDISYSNHGTVHRRRQSRQRAFKAAVHIAPTVRKRSSEVMNSP